MKKRILVLCLVTMLASSLMMPPLSSAATAERPQYTRYTVTEAGQYMNQYLLSLLQNLISKPSGTPASSQQISSPVVEPAPDMQSTPVSEPEASEPAETPVNEQPSNEQPVIDETMVVQPAVEEPAVEESVVEEPMAEPPVVLEYAINVAAVKNGQLIVDTGHARAGTIVNLTVTPDEGMQLVKGSLKYNNSTGDTTINGNSFIMPASDVTVSAEFEAIPASEFMYSITNSQATITGYNGSGGDVTIPGTLEGFTVTAISENAFAANNSLTSITIPEGVVSIGKAAFYKCTSLTSIMLPTSATSIGYGAFANCSSLTTIIIPSRVTSIGSYAFYNCSSLNSATFTGNAPTSFGSGVFAGCEAKFTVYYNQGAKGFTTPVCCGYPAFPLTSAYKITIATLNGGTITAESSSAKTGALVNLAITPNNGMQLKPGTLMFNKTAIAGNSFIMPSEDVTITAEFESVQTAYNYQDDFEGALAGFWVKNMPNTSYASTISSKFAFSGSSSLRIELHKDDPLVNASKRSEIRFPDSEEAAGEHTYSFATYLPNGGDEDYAVDPEGSEVIVQWHNTPDPGEGWYYPALTLHTYKGDYEVWRAWDDAAITSNEQITSKGNLQRYNLGSFVEDKGRWVQWTFKVKWGWLDTQDPRIQIFKDGVQVLDIKGPNTMNDQKGVCMNLGVYKWDWAQGEKDTSVLTKRVIYFDNVSVK